MDNSPPSPEAKPPFEFWAFISYSRKDKVLAKRLHEFIETYGVPVEFVEHPIAAIGEAAPARLRPCFRDIDDLPSGSSLPTALREKLAASRFLIVVCSPNSAASEWVDKEIIEFRALHAEAAEDRIHAIIIAGRPSRDAADCCFPPSLRDQNPCALNATVHGEGDRIAKLKLIAAMLGVPPDAIIRRDQERRMKRMKLAVAGALLLVSVVSWFWWQASAARDAEEKAKERAIKAEGKTAEQLKEATIQKQRADAATKVAETERDKARASANQAEVERSKANASASEAAIARDKTKAALAESNRRLELSQVEEGRAWLAAGREQASQSEHARALLLAGRALGYRPLGYHFYGRDKSNDSSFAEDYPPLLAQQMEDGAAEEDRSRAASRTVEFIDNIRTTLLPLWASNLGQKVSSVAFSPDGSLIACGVDNPLDGTAEIKLRDATTGKALATLTGHKIGVFSLVFSPDGRWLASGSADYTIKLWDVAKREEIATLPGHTGAVFCVAFSPNGRWLASGSSDQTVKLWDTTATGNAPITLALLKSFVNSVAFSPDGRLLASGSGAELGEEGEVKLWSLATSRELATLQRDAAGVNSVAFSPDSNLLASGSNDKTVKLWDINTRKELQTLRGHTNGVASVCFRPDGQCLVSGSGGRFLDKTGEIKIWNLPTGEELSTLKGNAKGVNSVAFSPDGTRLASGSEDQTIKLWDAAIIREFAVLQDEQTDSIRCVAFCPNDSRLASGLEDGTIKLWDTTTRTKLATLRGHTGKVNSVAFSPDGHLLVSGSSDETIKFWDTATGRKLPNSKSHKGWVNSVAFSPDGHLLASGSSDETIKLWNVATRQELAPFPSRKGAVDNIVFSPDGSRLADNMMRLWNVNTRDEIAPLQGKTDSVGNVAFSPDGKRLASRLWRLVVEDGVKPVEELKLWDSATREELETTNSDFTVAKLWLAASEHLLHSDGQRMAEKGSSVIYIVPATPTLDLVAPLRAGLATFKDREVIFPTPTETTPMIHYRQDTYAQLTDFKLTPERRAELRMELCTKSSQFRAATALWQRLLQGEWPGFEGATVPKDQAPATIPADSPIRRLYLLALIDATKHPQIHGHPTICQTAAQIAPVLTKQMMATPTISLAMMSLMQTLGKDPSPDMTAPRTALLKRLEEVATKEWLAVLRESATK